MRPPNGWPLAVFFAARHGSNIVSKGHLLRILLTDRLPVQLVRCPLYRRRQVSVATTGRAVGTQLAGELNRAARVAHLDGLDAELRNGSSCGLVGHDLNYARQSCNQQYDNVLDHVGLPLEN